MQEKPPGEALVEMESFEPGGTPRRPNAAAAGALLAAIITCVLALLVCASQPRDPLPPPWWYALLVMSGMTTLLALLGWAKSGRAVRTAGRKRSLSALILGVAGVVVALTVGSEVFFPKPKPVVVPKHAEHISVIRKAATGTAATTKRTRAGGIIGAGEDRVPSGQPLKGESASP